MTLLQKELQQNALINSNVANFWWLLPYVFYNVGTFYHCLQSPKEVPCNFGMTVMDDHSSLAIQSD